MLVLIDPPDLLLDPYNTIVSVDLSKLDFISLPASGPSLLQTFRQFSQIRRADIDREYAVQEDEVDDDREEEGAAVAGYSVH